MKRFMIYMLAVCLLLSGCSLFDGSNYSVTPHQDQTGRKEEAVATAQNYVQLRTALVDLVHSGVESSTINVPDYDAGQLERDLENAAAYAQKTDAIGAYAVDTISYEVGTNGFVAAVAVKITYHHGSAELRQIRTVKSMDEVWKQIGTALRSCDAGIVILVEQYSQMDMIQMVADYAETNPDTVMELPAVTVETFPETGSRRVVDIKFTYQNSRNDLRQMQAQVSPIFSASTLYVRGSSSDYQKLSQLYGFLMERFGEYQIKTSITPSYSLLHHGVGDSRAFARVYARMCKLAGLECEIVTGTRQGEPWSWNLVMDNGNYFHVDLLRCNEKGAFLLQTDDQMGEYVWDYSAYPVCSGIPAEDTAPATDTESENNSE